MHQNAIELIRMTASILVGSGVNLPMTIAHQSSHKIRLHFSEIIEKRIEIINRRNTLEIEAVVTQISSFFLLGLRIKA